MGPFGPIADVGYGYGGSVVGSDADKRYARSSDAGGGGLFQRYQMPDESDWGAPPPDVASGAKRVRYSMD